MMPPTKELGMNWPTLPALDDMLCPTCGAPFFSAGIVTHGNGKLEAICSCGKSLTVWMRRP